MINGLWGRKLGMTQVFSDDHQVVPVTAIDMSHWFVTQIKTKEHDGYDAVQFGLLRNRYRNETFSADWLKEAKHYFLAFKEARITDASAQFQIGQPFDIAATLAKGDIIDAFGTTIGKGFQGVVKRHGHKGGRASHGDKLGRGPGSLEGMRRSGRVRKGRKLPGHMGAHQYAIKNLEVVIVDTTARVVFVKGSVPGKSESLVFLRKCK
ncbi:MAG: 50S ribosomal protein L3 [candidate division TM6 bacterium GW2011_GWF2_43_87]|nr:MAG: 50S ribosomal protein L3 [candidate division TM6 bacterium GW2011_GWF2_43_87]